MEIFLSFIIIDYLEAGKAKKSLFDGIGRIPEFQKK